MVKKVIIIGASSGIGEKLALHYAKTGCMVGIAARREDKLAAIAEQYPNKMIYTLMDVTQTGNGGAVDKFLQLIEQLGGVDMVVYCSGAGEQNSLLDISKELNTVRVNVEGFMMIATAAFDYFYNKAITPESIVPQFVAISSVASVRGLNIATSYSASKRFQVTYMQGLAQLATKKGLKMTFTTLLPGFVRTDFIGGKKYPLIMSLDYAVRRMVRAIESRMGYAIIDWRWAIVVFFWKLIPEFIWRRIRL